MTATCPSCGGSVEVNASFCTWCGTVTGAASPPPGPVYGSQYPVHGPTYAYPPPYPYAYPQRTDTRRSLASSGCTLLMVTGGLALLLVPVAFLMGAFLAGTVLMAGALLSILGGIMAQRGIMPYMVLLGAVILIAGAILFMPASGFGIIYVLIGLVMVIASLAMILLGFKDLLERARARGRVAGTH